MSENKVKPVNLRSLLSRVRGPKVYVDPKSAKVSNRPVRDSVPIPKSTWWEGTEQPPFSSEAIEIISSHASEMAVYFPDFKLYSENNLFWLGKIDGIGEIRITYPLTYPAQKFEIEALELPESFTEELRGIVWDYEDITPAGAVIVLMRLFLLKGCNGT